MSRPHVSLKVKLASALLALGHIPHEEAKGLTTDEIVGRYDFDHAVHHALGGSIHPSNLTPMIRAEHRAKTAKIDIPAIAKVKRLTQVQEEIQRILLKPAGHKRKPSGRWPKRRFGS